jgi:hypothetical protein
MDAGLIQTIITTLGTITVAIITVVVKDSLDKRKQAMTKEKEEVITSEDMGSMLIVQEWLEDFRSKYDFERASIFQFHNGGKFFQGKSMKKFSMTYEVTAPGYEKVKRTYQNILASEYPRWITNMLEKKCFSTLVDDLEYRDRVDLESMGVKQFVTIPIHCLKGNLIGFLVGYNMADVDHNIRESFVSLVEDSKFVSGYISQ